MEAFLYIGLVAVGVMVGWRSRGALFLHALSENPDKVIRLLEEIKKINQAESEGNVVPNGTELAIERHGEVLYAFIKETNQFVAQGPNLKDLLETAHKRFPGKVFFGNIPEDSSAKELV